MSRPCWYLGLTWLVTCLIGAWLSLNVLFAVSLVCLLGTILLSILSLKKRQRTLLLILSAATVSFIWQTVRYTQVYLPIQQRVGSTITLETQVYETNGGIYVKVVDGDLPVGTRLQLYKGNPNLEVELYDTVNGRFVLKEYQTRGLSLFQQRASGAWFIAAAKGITVTPGKAPWTAVFSQWRASAVASVNSSLNGDVAALTAGICFGADEDLSSKAGNDFRACGVSHLFSVSGFHMAMLSQVLAAVFRRLRFPRLLRAISIATVLLLFMAMVGLEPSVVRSGLLCLLVLVSGCFRRQADTRNSLGLALLVLLAAEPFAAYDVGLLLSFCATFGLVLLFPKLSAVVVSWLPASFALRYPRLHRLIVRLIKAVCLTVSAMVATLPVSLIYFGEFSLAAVLGNLLTALPASALMMLGCLGSLFAPMWQVLGEVCFFFAGCIGQYLLFITEKISQFLPATVAITDRYLLLWIVGSIALLWLGYRVAHRRGACLTAAVSACTLLLSLSVHTWLMRDVATVRVLPADGEVAICVQQGGRTALICAPRSTDTVYDIRTALRTRGIGQVDTLVIPCADETIAAMTATILKEQLDGAAVVYGKAAQAVSFYTENGIALDSGEYSPWEDTTLGLYDSFVTLSVGQTRWLICTESDSVRAVPTEWWLVDTVVCGDRYPSDLPLVVGEWGVLLGDHSDIPSVYGTKQLVTVGDDDVVMMTRGAGEIDWK